MIRFKQMTKHPKTGEKPMAGWWVKRFDRKFPEGVRSGELEGDWGYDRQGCDEVYSEYYPDCTERIKAFITRVAKESYERGKKEALGHCPHRFDLSTSTGKYCPKCLGINY